MTLTRWFVKPPNGPSVVALSRACRLRRALTIAWIVSLEQMLQE